MHRAAWLFALLALTSPARGDSADDEIARAHFATGVTYYDQSRFGPAVKEFLDAYHLSHRSAFLYNIARAYEKLGDPGRASHYYRAYLNVTPRAAEKQEISAAIAAMRAKVGTLVLHTSSFGAEILVDEETIGLAPVDEQTLTAGSHTVELRRNGEVAKKTQVTIPAGQTTRLELDDAEPVVDVPPHMHPRLLPIVPPVVPPPQPSHRWMLPVVVVGTVVVVAAVVTGLVLGLAGTDYNDLGRQSCMGSGCVLLQPK